MTNFKKGDCVTLLPSSPYYENQLPEWNNGIGVIRSDIPVSVTDEYTVIIHSENYSNSYPLKDLKIVYKKDREKRKKQMVRDEKKTKVLLKKTKKNSMTAHIIIRCTEEYILQKSISA